jgi:ABC-type dipeptide/oligopeptide/nickel transport system permease subunit
VTRPPTRPTRARRRVRLVRAVAVMSTVTLIALLLPAPDGGLLAAVAGAARATLGVGLASAALGSAGGAMIAVLALLLAGRAEALAGRMAEVASAVPSVLLVPMLVVLPGGPTAALEARLVAALALVRAAEVVHLVLFESRALARAPFVEAARALGASRFHVLRTHLSRHIAPGVALSAGGGAAAAVAIETSAGFLGLLPGARGLGGLAAQAMASQAPGLLALAALAAAASLLAPVALAEALRDTLDPRG